LGDHFPNQISYCGCVDWSTASCYPKYTEGKDAFFCLFGLMFRGMTGYAVVTRAGRLGSVTAELSSLNRRHFELRALLPPYLAFLEPLLRRQIQEQISRGALTLTLKFSYSATGGLSIRPNLALLRDLKEAASQVADLLEISREAACEMIARSQGATQGALVEQEVQEREGHQEMAQEAVGEALFSLLEMKVAEGEAIRADISHRLKILRELRTNMAERAPTVLAAHREQTKERLAALVGQHVDADRILHEAAAHADRGDVSEELARLAHHLAALAAAADGPQLVSSRVVEFRLQEMQREVNTLGVKGSDLTLSELVIAAKAEIEKIREQIANVE
jgi:uncharacterized protein (TIGR00255 family)